MNIDKYIKWVEAGNRSFRVDINRQNEKTDINVWCYSYDLMEGTHIILGDDPPSDTFLRAKKVADLQNELKALEGK